MSLVLDSLVTLAWIYDDEATEAIRQVFASVADNGAFVPALWRLEIANSLTMAVRRNRIDPEFRRAALADMALPDITTDPHTEDNAWSDTLSLPDHFGSRHTTPFISKWRSGAGCRLQHSISTCARQVRRWQSRYEAPVDIAVVVVARMDNHLPS